jgi:Suppressor of fused protein (SUFU)
MGASADVIERHLRGFFRGHRKIHFRAWPGPIETRLPGFRVMVIPPGRRTGLWTYVSLGAHVVGANEHANEFFLLAPEASDAHVELVTMVAFYHAHGDLRSRLALGHTVPIGRPWLAGSECDCLLLSKPYPFGPALELCDHPGGHTQILWLLPITDRERAFRFEHDLEALEQRFDEVGLEYWRPDRASVV